MGVEWKEDETRSVLLS